MKSLTTVQKTFHVFQVLSKIAMILSLVWAGLAALGLLLGIVWYSGGNVVGGNQELLQAMTETGSLTDMIGVLAVSVILALTDATLFLWTLRYLKNECSDGTPFTHRGADELRRLGIKTIVLPLVAAIVAAVIYGILDVPSIAQGDWSNGPSLATGVTLILISLVFHYGADLEEKLK